MCTYNDTVIGFIINLGCGCKWSKKHKKSALKQKNTIECTNKKRKELRKCSEKCPKNYVKRWKKNFLYDLNY